MTTETTASVDILLPVADVDTEELLGAARIQVTPAMSVALQEVLADLRRHDNSSLILTKRCDGCEPAAWYTPSSFKSDLMDVMQDALDENGVDATTITVDANKHIAPGLSLPDAPEPGCPRGGIDGYRRIRAIDMHTDGNNVWWTAIASNGDDSEDTRIQTSMFPLSLVFG